MKHRTPITSLAVVVFAWLACAGLAQGQPRVERDPGTARHDIEVMKEVLRASLALVSEREEPDGMPVAGPRAEIDGYYLRGQGAVFLIEVPGPLGTPRAAYLAAAELAESARARALAGEQDRKARTAELAEALAEREDRERIVADLRAAEEMARAMDAEIRKSAEKEDRARAERLRQSEERVSRLADALVDTLAAYGDSLIQVRSDEYVTIVLRPETAPLFSAFVRGRPRAAAEIVSVRKSSVTEYKAGKIDLAGFRGKVLRYRHD